MAPGLFDRLRDLTGVGIEEIAGGGADGELPLADAALNRLIAGRIASSQLPIDRVRIQTQGGGQFDVHLTLRAPLPSIRLTVTIDQQPELPHSPVVGMRWSMPGLGPLARLAGGAMGFLKALPRWVRADGDRITVDLGQLLREKGLEDLLKILTRLQVTTRPGVFVVGFSIRT